MLSLILLLGMWQHSWPLDYTSIKRADGSPCRDSDLLSMDYVCVPGPEPIDVPAVQDKGLQLYCAYGAEWCDHGEHFPKTPGNSESMCLADPQFESSCAKRQLATCTDKSRVLLTSEDGKHHCIKFPSQ